MYLNTNFVQALKQVTQLDQSESKLNARTLGVECNVRFIYKPFSGSEDETLRMERRSLPPLRASFGATAQRTN
jgi:hypothetical protein